MIFFKTLSFCVKERDLIVTVNFVVTYDFLKAFDT